MALEWGRQINSNGALEWGRQENNSPLDPTTPEPDDIETDTQVLNINLPSWLNRGGIIKIALFIKQWWITVQMWLREPLTQLDPDTCTLGVLDLIASGRNIEQFDGEPEGLYRLRVKYAHVNARDAGSVAGLKRIFLRLNIGDVEVQERVEGRDWDVIVLQISDLDLSENQQLLTLLLTKYGRTCRRYEFNLVSSAGVGVSAHEFGHSWFYDDAL